MKLRNFEQLLPWLIVALAFFLRIWRAESLFPFTMDEEYQAFLAKNIIEGKHFPLIGVNVADTGLYLGPFFTYFSVIPYLLFGPSPIGGALFSALFGGLTVYFLIKTGETINKPVGLLAGLLSSVSFLSNAYDRKFWNPSLVPLLTILLMLALLKVKNNPRWWLVIFLVFGLAFHTHYSLFALLPVAIYFLWKNKIKLGNPWFKGGLLIFFFCLLPLIVFDLRHNFTNARALGKIVSKPEIGRASYEAVPKTELFLNTLSRAIYVPGPHDLAREIVSCATLKRSLPYYPLGLILILGLFFLSLSTKGFKEKALLQLLLGSFLSFTIFLLIYPRVWAEYYFLPLLPLSFLVLAWIFEKLMVKMSFYPRMIIAAGLLGLMIYNTISVVWMTNSFGLDVKRQLIGWSAKQIGDDQYSLDSVGSCYKFEGYRYLFTAFFKPPITSYVDPYFSWLYPDIKNTNFSSQRNVVIWNSLNDTGVKEDKEWNQWLTMAAKKRIIANFGAMKVLIKQ